MTNNAGAAGEVKLGASPDYTWAINELKGILVGKQDGLLEGVEANLPAASDNVETGAVAFRKQGLLGGGSLI